MSGGIYANRPLLTRQLKQVMVNFSSDLVAPNAAAGAVVPDVGGPDAAIVKQIVGAGNANLGRYSVEFNEPSARNIGIVGFHCQNPAIRAVEVESGTSDLLFRLVTAAGASFTRVGGGLANGDRLYFTLLFSLSSIEV